MFGVTVVGAMRKRGSSVKGRGPSECVRSNVLVTVSASGRCLSSGVTFVGGSVWHDEGRRRRGVFYEFCS